MGGWAGMLKTIKPGRGSRLFLMFMRKRPDPFEAHLPIKENPVWPALTSILLLLTAVMIAVVLFFFLKGAL
jgi:hypothetical protein